VQPFPEANPFVGRAERRSQQCELLLALLQALLLLMFGLGATVGNGAWIRDGSLIRPLIDHRFLPSNPARAGEGPCGNALAYQRPPPPPPPPRP